MQRQQSRQCEDEMDKTENNLLIERSDKKHATRKKGVCHCVRYIANCDIRTENVLFFRFDVRTLYNVLLRLTMTATTVSQQAITVFHQINPLK